MAQANTDTQVETKSKPNPSPFIDSKTASDAYDESNKWYRPYFDPLNEFERIARNKPSDKISKELPRITDGTMAAINQEQPKRIIQQIASGQVNCKEHPEFAKIADIVHRTKLLPLYNRMGTALQKHWNMLGKSMTYGRSTSYTFFTKTGNILHTDFIIPYAKDVLGEKGKVYAPDSKVSFMRTWYSSRDITGIINREKWLEANIKGYKSDWDLKKLADFQSAGASAKPADQQTPAEREKGDGNTGGFEVIHAFQDGIGAEFYSFSPQYKEGDTLRTKINKDPRGKMPLDHEYCNIDLSNPMGRGQIELSGGIQNLIDQQMQMFQFMTTLEMGPPLQVWGEPDRSTLKYRPNAVWEMGPNPNSSLVKPMDFTNSSIQNFPNNYGLLKSQILNLNSSQDHSIGADSGSPTQSKTQAGVQASEARLGVSDNYLRKQFETWFEAQTETSINVYFAEMTGKPTMQLEGQDLKDILKTPAKQFVDKKGILTIPYKEISDISFQFEVDASSSEVKEDADNADKLAQALAIIQKSEDPTVRAAEVKVTKLLLDEIGAEGTDDLFPDDKQTDENGNPVGPQPAQAAPQGPDPQQLQQMVMQMVQQAMQAEKQAPKPINETLGIQFKDLPEDAKQQVLAQIGIQSQMASPGHIDQTIKAHDSVSKAQQAEDSHDLAESQHNLATIQAINNEQSPEEKAAEQAQGQLGSSSDPKQGQISTPQDTNQQQPLDGTHALDPDEQELVKALFQRGFDENDAEQAITMLRQGVPEQQIIQTIGAKYATSN